MSQTPHDFAARCVENWSAPPTIADLRAERVRGARAWRLNRACQHYGVAPFDAIGARKASFDPVLVIGLVPWLQDKIPRINGRAAERQRDFVIELEI